MRHDMLTCGIDIGSSTIEIVLHDGCRIVSSTIAESGAAPAENALLAFRALLSELQLSRSDIQCIAGTGFGRNYFSGADKIFSEITCHVTGVVSLLPEARTLIEIGGQDSKMIRLDDRGNVYDFMMNDRCAAGTGRFIENAARVLGVTKEETGPIGLTAEQACDITSMCAVFAETEIVGLLHKGASRASILRGIFNSIARRILGMAGRIGLRDAVVFTGGVALNVGVVKALEEIAQHRMLVAPHPQFTGALGAALLATREMGSMSRTNRSIRKIGAV